MPTFPKMFIFSLTHSLYLHHQIVKLRKIGTKNILVLFPFAVVRIYMIKVAES